MEETPSQTNKFSEYLRRANSFRRSRVILLVGWLTPVSFLVSLAPLIDSFHLNRDGYTSNTVKPTDVTLILSLAFVFHFVAYFAMLSRLLEWHLLYATRIACVAMFFDGVLHTIAIVVYLSVYRFSDIELTTDFIAAIIEACLAFLISSLFIYDLNRTEDYEKCGCGLSHRARILIVVIMVAACWAGLGSIVYSLIEGWPYISALFFCLETLATIGFGSFAPQTLGGRIFIFFYATFGIMAMGFMFAGINVSVSEMIHYKSLMKFAKSLERGREEILQEQHNLGIGAETTILSLKRYQTWDDLGRKLIEEKENEMKKQLYFALCAASLFWVLGAAIFCITEHWSYIEALYFCFVAFTTIGYGDVIPMSPVGAPIFIVYVFLGVGTMTYLVSIVIENWSQHIRRAEVRSAKKKKKFKRGMQIVRVAAEPANETHEETGNSLDSAIKELVRVAKQFDEHMKIGLTPLVVSESTHLPPILEVSRTRTIEWDKSSQNHTTEGEEVTKKLTISPKLDVFLLDSYQQALAGLVELTSVVDDALLNVSVAGNVPSKQNMGKSSGPNKAHVNFL
ncbi:voltage-gated potassium channel [Basidiobolus meristosporus CBS 931.73]|uniref:Voltage-gated potassium channel n=1 Tax=Basidiobolus meristosporus CBS 931.73 TaxID=1314790 RepID=A0A1Y1YCM7_9FUNG|nr:voltage-gated potassium channel [Basidiobolus meristosporus CBS 931.73]|eukprot:ORX95683.1 voltage-gated potassium channel [Basidiobolus meristosporus CBS 931.73]